MKKYLVNIVFIYLFICLCLDVTTGIYGLIFPKKELDSIDRELKWVKDFSDVLTIILDGKLETELTQILQGATLRRFVLTKNTDIGAMKWADIDGTLFPNNIAWQIGMNDIPLDEYNTTSLYQKDVKEISPSDFKMPDLTKYTIFIGKGSGSNVQVVILGKNSKDPIPEVLNRRWHQRTMIDFTNNKDNNENNPSPNLMNKRWQTGVLRQYFGEDVFNRSIDED